MLRTNIRRFNGLILAFFAVRDAAVNQRNFWLLRNRVLRSIAWWRAPRRRKAFEKSAKLWEQNSSWHQTKTGRHYWYLLTQTKFLIGIIAIHTPAEDFSNPGFSGLPPGFIGANWTNWWPNAVAQLFYRDRITAHVAEVKRHIPISTGRLNLSLAACPIREM